MKVTLNILTTPRPNHNVTRFAKRGLIHASDFATLMSHNFVIKGAMRCLRSRLRILIARDFFGVHKITYTSVLIMLIQLECEISDAALSSSYWKGKLHLDKASTSNAYVVGRIPKSDDELASYLLATIEANRSIRVAESCAIPETTIR